MIFRSHILSAFLSSMKQVLVLVASLGDGMTSCSATKSLQMTSCSSTKIVNPLFSLLDASLNDMSFNLNLPHTFLSQGESLLGSKET